MSEHTPGPWEQSRGRHSPKDKDRRCFWVVNQADDGREDLMPRICDIYAPRGVDGSSEAEANAKLIAASPDLLKMLRELEDHATKYGGVPESATKLWDRVRAVIANATPSQPQGHEPRVQVEPEHQILIR